MHSLTARLKNVGIIENGFVPETKETKMGNSSLSARLPHVYLAFVVG